MAKKRKNKNKGKGKGQGKKFIDKIKQLGGKAAGAALFAPLLPFKLAMKQILKAKGIEPKSNIGDLAQQFKSVIIDKKGTYELEPYEHLAPSIVAAIISGILGFFKDLKRRKEAGEPLSDAEHKALDSAEKAVGGVIQEEKEEIVRDTKASLTMPLIIGLVVVVVMVIAFKKKK